VYSSSRLIELEPPRIAADKLHTLLESEGFSLDDLREAIVSAARARPFLGICIGLQMLFDHSEEGDTPGLGLLPGTVRRFPAKDMVDAHGAKLKVPHMGWNRIVKKKESPFLQGITDGDYLYFVHSYYVTPADVSVVATTTTYGTSFVSSIATDHLFACQFHPEKSQKIGLRILDNFARFAEKA